MKGLRLSIIIVTYNRCADLRECLDSIFNMRELPHEVLVVDSFSNDCTREVVRDYPVKYIQIPERSMVKARNVGLRHATGDIIAYVDDDAIVSNEWSIHILEPYNDRRVCGVGGRVLPYGVSEPEYHINTLRAPLVVGRVLENGVVLANFDIWAPSPIEVDTFIGTNMSFRKEALTKIGGFDENFVGNCFREETDVCLRLRRLGCILVYSPKALVWHKWRSKKLGIKRAYWTARNHAYFYFKNFRPITFRRLYAFFQGLSTLRRLEYAKRMGIHVDTHPLAYPIILTGVAVGMLKALTGGTV